MRLLCLTLALLAACVVGTADDFAYVPLDDFEDASPWVKGDPKTDMTQRDAAVYATDERVRQGEQSIAFEIHVNWTPREGEEYPKGWPMVMRDLQPPRDLSEFDRVFFWLYTETEDPLPQGRVLRVGFFPEGEEARGDPWYTIPGIRPGEWQEVSVPLDHSIDLTRINRMGFYVAEQWYQDGDRITFYIDDMRLARRLNPVFLDASSTARTHERDVLVVDVKLEGTPDPERHSVRCTVMDAAGRAQSDFRWRVKDKLQRFDMSLHGVSAGDHRARIELLDEAGHVLDSREQYFRSLPQGERSYLNLITFYSSGMWHNDNLEMLEVLNASAYAGVAVPLWGAYDTEPVEDFEDVQPKLDRARELSDIDLWPWVFSNRFIGIPEDARRHGSRTDEPPEYFQRIPILDLDNETGARADMMKMWRIAVRAARHWDAPGIVLDLEAYNNYPSYHVKYTAERRGESYATVIDKCEKVGEDLARIVEEEYPQCIIWTLFSRLDRPSTLPGCDSPVYPVPGHISLGFLRYAKAHHLPCKYLCGGETSPGYYNRNLDALRDKIVSRDRDMAPMLQQFPDHFFLAGTISPYHDLSVATSWIKARAGDDPELKTIQDFEPMFRELFVAYQWNWIYASSAAKTLPYDPEHSEMYSEVLEAALQDAAGGR